MDLDRPEVSYTLESSLHCNICSTCQSCPVQPALSFAILLLCCMLSLYVLLSVTVYCILYMYVHKHILFRVVLHIVVTNIYVRTVVKAVLS